MCPTGTFGGDGGQATKLGGVLPGLVGTLSTLRSSERLTLQKKPPSHQRSKHGDQRWPEAQANEMDGAFHSEPLKLAQKGEQMIVRLAAFSEHHTTSNGRRLSRLS